jgi:hypothetical protein
LWRTNSNIGIPIPVEEGQRGGVWNIVTNNTVPRQAVKQKSGSRNVSCIIGAAFRVVTRKKQRIGLTIQREKYWWEIGVHPSWQQSDEMGVKQFTWPLRSNYHS